MSGIKSLKVGQSAEITAYLPGAKRYRRRLMAMGLIIGTSIKVMRFAPLGCPVQLSVRGGNVCLRKEEADVLVVELL